MEFGSVKEIDAFYARYINWNIFIQDSKKETHLEIGFGNGDYLVNLAKSCPSAIFYGIEYNPKYFKKGLLKAEKMEVKNILLFCTEAKSFVHNLVPDDFFNYIHINFPDPWPKKRHNRRRLIDDNFVKELWRVLKPNGVVFIATDFYEYFLNIVSIFQVNNFLKLYFGNKPYEPRKFKTKYEKNFENQGIPIFYSVFKKRVDKVFYL